MPSIKMGIKFKQLKTDYKLRRSQFSSAKSAVIVKAVNCIGFINAEAHSEAIVARLAALLRTPQIAYLLPAKKSLLRCNAAFRIAELSIDASSNLVPNSVEKAYITALELASKRPGSDGMLVDLIVLANVFDKFARESILKPTSKMLYLEVTSAFTRYQAVARINEAVLERIDELAAWLDSLVCLAGTSAFAVPHYCSKTCHVLPPALPDGKSTVFQLPGLDITPNSTPKCYHCGQLTTARITGLKKDIQVVSKAPKNLRLDAWRKLSSFCHDENCTDGLNCKAPIHQLRMLEHCFLGPRLMLHTLMALGTNLEFAAAFEEAKCLGRSDKLIFCFKQIENFDLDPFDPLD
uniref:ThiF domain-containing protein n=1 Tax=Panagrellus redivivus TaxID=6233 RepID=A0A7E4V8A0_PANRE